MDQTSHNWKAEWRKLDTIGRGTLPFAELPILVERLGVELTDEELHSAANRIQKWQASRMLVQGFARWFTGNGGNAFDVEAREARGKLRELRAVHAREMRSLSNELESIKEDHEKNLIEREDALSQLETLKKEHSVQISQALADADNARAQARDLESKYEEMRQLVSDLRQKINAQEIECETRLEEMRLECKQSKQLLYAATTKSTGDRLRAMGAALMWRNVFVTLDRAATLRTQSAPTLIQSVWRGSLERRHVVDLPVIPTSGKDSMSTLDKKKGYEKDGEEGKEPDESQRRDNSTGRGLDVSAIDDESSLENLDLDHENESIKRTPRKNQEVETPDCRWANFSFDYDEATMPPDPVVCDPPIDEKNSAGFFSEDASEDGDDISAKIFIAEEMCQQEEASEASFEMGDQLEEEDCIFDLDEQGSASNDEENRENVRPSEDFPPPLAPKMSASPLRSSLKSGNRPRRRVSLGSSDSLRVVCFNSEDPPSVIAETPDEPRREEDEIENANDGDIFGSMKSSLNSRNWGANLTVPGISIRSDDESTAEGDGVYTFEDSEEDEYENEDYEFDDDDVSISPSH